MRLHHWPSDNETREREREREREHGTCRISHHAQLTARRHGPVVDGGPCGAAVGSTAGRRHRDTPDRRTARGGGGACVLIAVIFKSLCRFECQEALRDSSSRNDGTPGKQQPGFQGSRPKNTRAARCSDTTTTGGRVFRSVRIDAEPGRNQLPRVQLSASIPGNRAWEPGSHGKQRHQQGPTPPLAGSGGRRRVIS